MPILALLVVVSLIEIAVFILVGRRIGVAPTLLLTLGAAVAGAALLRVQGLAAIERIRAELAARRLPARPLADGAMIALGGLLLIVPGFATDALGLLLFIPAVRDALWRRFAVRLGVAPRTGARPHGARRRVIDLERHEFEVRPEVRAGKHGPDGETPSLPRNRSA